MIMSFEDMWCRVDANERILAEGLKNRHSKSRRDELINLRFPMQFLATFKRSAENVVNRQLLMCHAPCHQMLRYIVAHHMKPAKSIELSTRCREHGPT